MKNNGNVYYLDDYGTEYEVQWTLLRSTPVTIDITTITRQPVAWGETYTPIGATPLERGGYVENFVAYRRGIISTIRQILRVNEAGYEIVSASEEQKIDYFAAQRRKKTPFRHYLDQQYIDQSLQGVSVGACFGDIAEDYEMGVWADPDDTMPYAAGEDAIAGAPIAAAALPVVLLTYIDVWE